MKKFLKTKWLVLLAVTAVLVVFGRLVDTRSIASSALVIGLGIDYVDGKFTLSAESVVTSGSSSEGGTAQSFVVYEGGGYTLNEAIGEIEQKMGLNVSLSHCNVLVMSFEALKYNHVDLVKPLIDTYAISEQCIVVTTPTDPIELLSKKTATTISTPFFIQSVLLPNQDTNGLNLLSIKDFVASSLSRSKASVAPCLTLSVLPDEPVGDKSENQTENFVVNFKQAAAFSSKGDVVLLDEDLAFAAAAVVRNQSKGSISAETADGIKAQFKITAKNPKRKFSDMTQTLTLDLRVTVGGLAGASKPTEDDSSRPAAEDLLTLATTKLEGDILKCVELSKTSGIDFLGLENYAYQNLGVAYGDTPFTELNLKILVKAELT